MPAKKKTAGRSSNSSSSKGKAKAAPIEASEASAAENTRATKASEKRDTNADKPRAKRGATAKTSTRGSRKRADPLSAVLAEAPPTREQIAFRAYELFIKGGYQHGHSEEHWFQAERELKREYAAKKRAPSKQPPTFSSF